MSDRGQQRICYVALQSVREGQAAHAHVHEIVQGLQKLGWRVSLHAAQTQPQDGMLRRVLAFLGVQLAAAARMFSIQVLYVRWHAATAPIVLLAKLCRRRVVLEVNGTYSDIFLVWPALHRISRCVTWLMRVQLRKADARIAVAPDLAKWVETESGGKTCVVIPNGADPDRFRPDADPLSGVEPPYVAFVGALSPWQGVDTMLDAVASPAWPKDVSLAIAGHGTESERAEEAASRNNAIQVLGVISYEDVPRLIAHGLCCLSVQGQALMQLRKDFSAIKVFESLACGTPVIVSPYPSQKALVEEAECGIVVPFDDADALAEAVAHLYANPEVRSSMGQRGRSVIISKHSWAARARATDAVLTEVLAVGHRGEGL